MFIKENIERIKKEIPDYVTIVAATKSRNVNEINEAINAGIKIIGENYVQEALKKYKVIGNQVKWHMIGHLQSNKVKKALFFDMIQTIDRLKIAKKLDNLCAGKKIMPCLVQVNISGEKTKFGIRPEEAIDFIKQLSELNHIRIKGLMTMEPYLKNPEDARPYFRKMKNLFYYIKNLNIPNVEMKILSMGMSSSYKIAIEEGSNMIRIGTKIFGKRKELG